MKKAVVIVGVLIIILSVLIIFQISPFLTLNMKSVNPNFQNEDNRTSITLSINEVAGLLYLSKEEVIEKLGKNFESKAMGYEGTSDGLYYKNRGITLVMGNYSPKNKYCVYRIDCDKGVIINGAKAGTDFLEIQGFLGKIEVKEDIGENGVEYILSYTIDGLSVNFKSKFQNGKESSLYIFGNP